MGDTATGSPSRFNGNQWYAGPTGKIFQSGLGVCAMRSSNICVFLDKLWAKKR